jgi:hypothetical protein
MPSDGSGGSNVHQSVERMPGVTGEIQRFCVKGLRPEHHLVIAARLHAGTTRRAAALLHYSESQTKRRWDEVKDFVLVPLGLARHDDVLAGLWIALHAGCCTAPAISLLENDSRFTSAVR